MFWVTSIAQFFSALFSKPAKPAEKEDPQPQKVDGLILPSTNEKWHEEVGETLWQDTLYLYELEKAKSILSRIKTPCKTAEAELNRRLEQEALSSKIEQTEIALEENKKRREACKNRLREEEKAIIFSARIQWDGGWIDHSEKYGSVETLKSKTRRQIVVVEGIPVLICTRETGSSSLTWYTSALDQFSKEELVMTVARMKSSSPNY